MIALEMMSLGLDLRRAGERARHPDETDGAIEARFQAWLHQPQPLDVDFREIE